jgi:hypothetical protein
MFVVDWLFETYYLRPPIRLSHIPHFTTLQKFTERINNALLEKIIPSFIAINGTNHIFVGIDSSGFKVTQTDYSHKIDVFYKAVPLM